jgi:hypothetical protein
MAKYLYLLYADEAKLPRPGSPQFDELNSAYGRYYEEVSGKGLFQSGDPVQPSAAATTVRVRNGSTQASAGPAAPTGDQIIGFYVMDCKDQNEAVAYAAKVPAASVGAVEVRPILAT